MDRKEAMEKYPYIKRMAKKRARVWAFVCWDESTDYDLLCRTISDLHTPAVISPLHDMDAYTESDVDAWKVRHEGMDWSVLDVPGVGELKKPHWHVLISWAGSKSYLQMLEAFDQVGVRYFQKVESKGGYIRYMVHMDDPDKAQYSMDNLQAFGGIDLSCLVTISQLDKQMMMKQIMDHIYANRITSFANLCRWAMVQEDPDIWTTVTSGAVFFRAVISDFRWDLAQKEKKEKAALA